MLTASIKDRSIYDTDRDPGLFIPFIQAVGRGEKLKRDLTYDESVEALRQIVEQTCSPAQAGAFLVTQRVKGEAVDEIRGFTELLRSETITQIQPRVEGLLDLAVPYDGKVKSAQLAPSIAIVLAEAGMPVALHGDEAVPTKSGIGPGPVLRELGIADDLEPEAVERMIESVGVGYLSAPRFAPQWHDLLPLRRQFGLRTVLNSVEKFLNPANAPYQVSGFFHGNYIERLRVVQTGAKRSFIVQGEEGSVEMAVGRKTHIFAEDATNDLILDPGALGHVERVRVPAPEGVAGHATLNAAVLAGEQGDATEQVCLTVAVILHLFDLAQSMPDGIGRARKILATGAAQKRLERMVGG